MIYKLLFPPRIAARLQGDEGAARRPHLHNSRCPLSLDGEISPSQGLQDGPGGGAALNDEVVGAMNVNKFFHFLGCGVAQVHGRGLQFFPFTVRQRNILACVVMMGNGEDDGTSFDISLGVPTSEVAIAIVDTAGHGRNGNVDVYWSALRAATDDEQSPHVIFQGEG